LLGDGERRQDEADEKSTDQGKIFHFPLFPSTRSRLARHAE
jgi:hypothetical protein